MRLIEFYCILLYYSIHYLFIGLFIINTILTSLHLTPTSRWQSSYWHSCNRFLLIISSAIIFLIICNITFQLRVTHQPCYISYFKHSYFCIDQYTLIFLPLITFLFFYIFLFISNDFSTKTNVLIPALLLLYYLILNFLLTNNLIYFFIIYELIIIIVFFLIVHSGNNNGNIEAILFFLAWAIIGSLFVSLGVIYILTVTQTTNFIDIYNYPFLADEIYYLSICFFIGFGTKLALWPFWYWLPRAHVEVSTSLSIFLSCILLKLCLYGFLRLLYILNTEVICLPFIYCLTLAVIDVSFRITTQTDLKAITAYSSVLHINLLVLIILLDSTHLSLPVIIYIWAHSLTTASTFTIISFIEKYYYSRHIFEISGMFLTCPLLAYISIWNLLTLIGFPLHCFFWSLCWLILIMLHNFPTIAILVLCISEFFYIIMIFRFWLGLLLGVPSINTSYPAHTLNYFELTFITSLLLIQFLLGLQPQILMIFIVN